MTDLDHPFHVDGRGRTAAVLGPGDHLKDMIEQVLFTSPGERVNRPDFGSALLSQVFEPNSDQLAAALQFLVQGALQQWLGDLIEVESVEVDNDDATLLVEIVYVVRATQERRAASFTQPRAAS